MIDVRELTKAYPGATAIDRISFSIERGEIVGFLGPNGAGKTTTMRVLTAFLRPTSGQAQVAGHDVDLAPIEVRRSVGYLPENVPLYGEMRVAEFLRWRARLKGVARRQVGGRVDEVVGRCGLGDVRNRIIEQLSKGYRQRVGLAEALVHDPPILILDEPTVGLDPHQIRQVRALITELGRQHTILLSSHVLPEVEQVCGRIIIINRGKIVAQDRPEALRRSLEGQPTLLVEVRPQASLQPAAVASAGLSSPGAAPVAHDGGSPGEAEVLHGLLGLEGVVAVETEPGEGAVRARMTLQRGRDLREEVFRLAVARGWILRELSQRRLSLEDIFVDLTTRENEDAASAAGNPPLAAESGGGPA